MDGRADEVELGFVRGGDGEVRGPGDCCTLDVDPPTTFNF